MAISDSVSSLDDMKLKKIKDKIIKSYLLICVTKDTDIMRPSHRPKAQSKLVLKYTILEWQKNITDGLKEYCSLIDSSSSFRAYR